MTTCSPLHTSARHLVAALQTGDGAYQAEAYDLFRSHALAVAANGHAPEAIAACQFVMRMRPADRMLSIPEAAGLIS